MRRHLQLCLIALAVLTKGVLGSERYPEPAEICLTAHPNGGSGELGCREDLAGGLQCRDTEKCKTEKYYCSDEDVARRAGNTCDGWPGYNGGYPLSKLHWDSESEHYECAVDPAAQGNSTFCDRWITLEKSNDEWEAGECECTQTAINSGREYCHKWTCDQIEVDRCIGSRMVTYGSSKWRSNFRWGGWGWSDNTYETGWLDTKFPDYTVAIRGDWDYFPYQCYKCGGDHGCRVFGPEVEEEHADCECKQAANGACIKWYCEEYDDGGHHEREFEWYNATEVLDNGVVIAWDGDIDSKSEFEFSLCECDTLSENGLYCLKWSCREKGMGYFYPNLLWSMLHFPIMILPGLIFLYIRRPIFCVGGVHCFGRYFSPKWISGFGFCVSLLWLAGWQICFVWLGGIGEFIIALSMGGAVVLFFCCFTCGCFKR